MCCLVSYPEDPRILTVSMLLPEDAGRMFHLKLTYVPIYKPTGLHSPEDQHRGLHRRQNLRSHTLTVFKNTVLRRMLGLRQRMQPEDEEKYITRSIILLFNLY